PVPVLPASPDKKTVERQDQGDDAHGGGDDQRGTHLRQLSSLNKMQRAYEADRRRGSKHHKPGRQERLHRWSGGTPGDPLAEQAWHADQEDRDQEVKADRHPVGQSADPADIEDAQVTASDHEYDKHGNRSQERAERDQEEGDFDALEKVTCFPGREDNNQDNRHERGEPRVGELQYVADDVHSISPPRSRSIDRPDAAPRGDAPR